MVAALPDEVWARVTSFEGINHELMPILSMSVPHGAESLDVATVPIGTPLGRSLIRLFGILPVDHDDLTIAALDLPGRSFHERSTMFSATLWEHTRTLTAVGDHSTLVHDRVIFVPRVRLTARLHARMIAMLFGHRHRRLARHFATR